MLTPPQPVHSYELSSGDIVCLKKPTEIAALVLSSPNCGDRFNFAWNYNSGFVDRSWNSDGWLYDCAFFRDFILKGYPYDKMTDQIYLISTVIGHCTIQFLWTD